jgi:predicted nucleic acid-binding protein
VVDRSDTTQKVVVDASPLIYLAKLRALVVFQKIGLEPLVPEAVIEETTKPSLIYRHPDAAVIESALDRGELSPVSLTPGEQESVDELAQEVPGMHRGECQVLVVARSRAVPAVLFERRGRSIAKAFGIALIDVVELLFDGTSDNELLEERFRPFAELVDMRLADYEALRERIARRRLV